MVNFGKRFEPCEVTQEIFDVRLTELKKEFHCFVREVQVQIEDVTQVF